MTVYPGLIDMGSSAGLEAPAIPRAENPQTTEDIERVKRETLLRPHLRAADYMNPSAAALAKAAETGITAILATPASDGIRGQSALVLTSIGADLPQIGALADDRRGPLVVRTPVALHVGIANSPAGGDAYPNSLMGNIAFNRQAFLDAQWYQQAKATSAIRRRSTRCSPRWRAACRWRSAPRRRAMCSRALDMAKMFKLDPIITGAREVEAVTGEIKAANARVIYSLNFPTRRVSLRAGCRRTAERASRSRQRAEGAGRRSTRPASCSRLNRRACPKSRTS